MHIDSGAVGTSPLLLLHGGAGNYPNAEVLAHRRKLLAEIVTQHWSKVTKGDAALTVAMAVIESLENEPSLNAGYGSRLQHDGMARLTASVMDGAAQRFSAVNLVTEVKNPSTLALALQSRKDRALGPYGAQLLARELGITPTSPVAMARIEELLTQLREEADAPAHGTVGVVVRDKAGKFAACTSTGGTSTKYPERMSDVGTVAGNYASAFAAISCTGIGEQIVDDAVAARLEARVRDGKTIIAASDASYAEAEQRKGDYGWIAADKDGNWAMYSASQAMACAVMAESYTEPLVGGVTA